MNSCAQANHNLPYGTIGSVASLLATTFYLGNHDKKHKLCKYRINWERYTLYLGAAGMVLHMNGKFIRRKLKQTCGIVLLQIQWARCDQYNHWNQKIGLVSVRTYLEKPLHGNGLSLENIFYLVFFRTVVRFVEIYRIGDNLCSNVLS